MGGLGCLGDTLRGAERGRVRVRVGVHTQTCKARRRA